MTSCNALALTFKDGSAGFDLSILTVVSYWGLELCFFRAQSALHSGRGNYPFKGHQAIRVRFFCFSTDTPDYASAPVNFGSLIRPVYFAIVSTRRTHYALAGECQFFLGAPAVFAVSNGCDVNGP